MTDAERVAHLKPKKKCCKSDKRCLKCPFVVHKMKKAVHQGLTGKDLKRALKKARAA